ncbi:recombinase family protein [Streptomyces sp. NPDC004237]|uniref:recombinase family protein n=1 Tax=Streptomyces sp. NPDC004237 TaxID=3154455 RepID=UPI0033ABF36F
MLPIPQRPCLYTRLSYAPDGSLEKCENQETDGRAAGLRLGWPDFCCVYVDNSRSAWQRNRKRPDWDRMLITLDRDSGRLVLTDPKANHHHDGIMTYHGDRLIRQPYDLEVLLTIADTRRIPLASVSGVKDLSSADDRFILRIEAAQACREVDNLSRRRKRGYRSDVERRGHGQQGGSRPYGWGQPTGRTKTRRDPATGAESEVPILDYNQVVPEEAKHLVKAAQKLLAGMSMRGVLAYMNSVSTTTLGGSWSSRTMWQLITSPRVAGLIELDGVMHKAVWDQVISPEQREALLALHERRRAENPNPGAGRRHLLSGRDVLLCHRCKGREWGHKPTTEKGRARRTVYYCQGCRLSRSDEHLDAYVAGRVLRLLNSPRFLAQLQAAASDRTPELAADIAALEERKRKTKQQLEDLAEHPDVDPALAMMSLASFDRKITQLRSQMAMSATHRLLTRVAGFSLEAWQGESIDVQHDVVAALFEIEVLPAQRRGPGFDPESVKLHRKSLGANGSSGVDAETQLQENP